MKSNNLPQRKIIIRAVRQGIADCPHPCRGLSSLSRGLSVKATRTSSSKPRKTDRPRGARGLSARHPRTVRPVHTDRPKLRPTKTQSHDGSKAKASKNMKNTGRIGTAWTVRLVLPDHPRGADRAENARPRKSTPPIHHPISQTVEAVETRVWAHEKRQPRMLYPKNLAS
jgi:hypothetical protein